MVLRYFLVCVLCALVSASADGNFDWEADRYDYMMDWSPSGASLGWGGRHLQPHCVDIPSNMTLCNDIGYTKMRLPNLLEHDTLQEATQQSSQWTVLAERGCHPDTKLFLCSLFSPVCLDQLIYPCRYVPTLFFFFNLQN